LKKDQTDRIIERHHDMLRGAIIDQINNRIVQIAVDSHSNYERNKFYIIFIFVQFQLQAVPCIHLPLTIYFCFASPPNYLLNIQIIFKSYLSFGLFNSFSWHIHKLMEKLHLQMQLTLIMYAGYKLQHIW